MCEGFFPRGSVPSDIDNSSPNPSSWPAPQAFFAAATCPPDQFFKDHVLVINTSICGDLGNPTYAAAGCPGTCADQVADPANYNGRFQSVLVLGTCSDVLRPSRGSLGYQLPQGLPACVNPDIRVILFALTLSTHY